MTIHHHLEDAPNGRLKKGSKLTQYLKLAGKKFKVRWTVVENDPCERVVWEGRGPVASHARVVYGFEGNGDGTTFSYLNEYDLPGGAARAGGGPRGLACDPKGAGRFLATPQVVSRVTVNG